MKATYDRQADALYVHVAPERGPIARTVQTTNDLMVDVNADGQVVGVEVLHAAAPRFDLARTLAQFKVDLRDLEISLIGAETVGLPALGS